MTSIALGNHLYTLCQCPVCDSRYALAPMAADCYAVWDARYPLGNPIAMYAATDRLCYSCLMRAEQHEMKVTMLVAALTANGSWLDLTLSATNQLVRG